MDTENTSDIYKSRTQIKKESEELQKLGERLIKLSPGQLAGIDIPEELRRAVADARQISARKASHRNRQFIGALMRQCDPTPVREALDRIDAGLSVTSKPRNAPSVAAQWAAEILENDDAIESFLNDHPSGDRQRIRQLKRNALRKRAGDPNGKEFKALISAIQEAVGGL